MLSLIVARDRNGAIGKDGTIPWRAPEDLAMFKRETLGGAIIMGRRTWDSLPVRPLKDRVNIVVSRDPGLAEHVVATPQVALDLARALGCHRAYGIGGAAIYAALLPLADRLLVTEVDLDIADPDTHFPEFSRLDWRAAASVTLRDADPGCVLTEYLRVWPG